MIETHKLLKTLNAVGAGYAGDNYAHQARDLITTLLEQAKDAQAEFTRMEDSWRTECDRLRQMYLNEVKKDDPL